MWAFFSIKSLLSALLSSPRLGRCGSKLTFNRCFTFSAWSGALKTFLNSAFSHSSILALVFTLLLSLPLPTDAQTDTPAPTPSPTLTPTGQVSTPTPPPTLEPVVCVTSTPVVSDLSDCPIFERGENLLTQRYRNSCGHCLTRPTSPIPSVPICGKPSQLGLPFPTSSFPTATLSLSATPTSTPTITPTNLPGGSGGSFNAVFAYEYRSTPTSTWVLPYPEYVYPISPSLFQLSGGGLFNSTTQQDTTTRRWTSSTSSATPRTVSYRVYDATFGQDYYVRFINANFWGLSQTNADEGDVALSLRVTLIHFDDTQTILTGSVTTRPSPSPYTSHGTWNRNVYISELFTEPAQRVIIDVLATSVGSGSRYIAIYLNSFDVQLSVSDGLMPVWTPTPTFTPTSTPYPTSTPDLSNPTSTPYAGDGTPRPFVTQDRWGGDTGGVWSDCTVPEYIDDTPAMNYEPSQPICSENNLNCDFNNPDYQCHTLIPNVDGISVLGFTLGQIQGVYACIQWITFPSLAILGITIPLDFLLLLPVFYIIRRLIQF